MLSEPESFEPFADVTSHARHIEPQDAAKLRAFGPRDPWPWSRRGLWASEFVPPWEWRQGKRLGGAEPEGSPPGHCLIKGSISREGERIYHLPGGRWYDQTKIELAKGERWFCSEAEARAAEWRRAMQ